MVELVFENSSARVAVDAEHGGRIKSFAIANHELIVERTDDPLTWGFYPMVPFAGRIRRGVLLFDGIEHQLPPALGAHAIHGNGFTSAWTVVADDEIEWEFTSPWPFSGIARQRFELLDDRLVLDMQVTAHERQPISMGWHPWFRRDIGIGQPVSLEFSAACMYELDDDEIPTGALISPTPGPWDNCFTGDVRGPRLVWGDLSLDLTASSDHWIVYNKLVGAVCVEPQTGPPDAVNAAPQVLEAGESARIEFLLRWSTTGRER